jgi:hypothetical protein
MSRKQLVLLIMIILASIFLAAGCGSQSDEPGVDIESEIAAGVAATLTAEAEQTAQAEPEQIEAVEDTETPEPTETPEIVHEMVPGEPLEISNTYLTDFNSFDFAGEGFTYGDQYLINRYERPFTKEMLEYHGYLDLILVNLKVNPPWTYAELFLADELPEEGEATYSLELDLDEDGRGDILVSALLPISDEWTVDGVRVYEDKDGDVGGENPLIPDPVVETLTGYEELIFDSGLGDDSDLAWVRRHPEDPTALEIAYKTDLTQNAGYLWSVVADEGLQEPGMADYNDWFSLPEAGSPFPEHEYHPIQEIYLVDSTCRSWYGYEPEGGEIGLCQQYIKEGPDKGWKLCYTAVYGSTSATQCDNVCMKSCPDNLPRGFSCEPCNLPKQGE